MATRQTILLVESEVARLDALDVALRRCGYHVLTAIDGDRAAELLARRLPDAVVLDMLLACQSGFQIARLVKESSDWTVPVVMYTSLGAEVHRDYAVASGVDYFLENPSAPEVVQAVETFCPQTTAPRLAGSGSLPWSMSTPS